MRPWNDHPKPDSLRFVAQVTPSEIGYVCAIVEGHEGLAVVRTKDESLGIVEFWVTRYMREDFEDFLQALARELDIKVIKIELMNSETGDNQ